MISILRLHLRSQSLHSIGEHRANKKQRLRKFSAFLIFVLFSICVSGGKAFECGKLTVRKAPYSLVKLK